ncbi:putative intracellular protease/amidase [Acetobacter malorum DSM 14337]|uniref:Intracellular protease/amidase n=1 Tax=Acetobacter malorum DSM 14337 TaxID=1307910 RepID=A0ABQ0PQ68_9PROT|nr:putative intracellular protease/amidase [Acetobacter malorum DSM 14337]
MPLFGAIPDEGRVFTGGGVTAGIHSALTVDFALTVLVEISGENVAQTLQLGLEYAPEPPFIAGRPETAPPNILAGYRDQIAPLLAQREAQAREAAVRLSSIC